MKHCTLTERIDQLLGDGRVADIILRPGIPLRYSIHDRFQIDPDVVVGEEDFASIVKEAGLNCEAKDDDRQWKRGNRSLRCNLLTAQGIPQICMRIFPAKPPLFDDQQCDFPKSPELRQKILEPKKGIIFLVGTPGSGKSTTCAALIHEYARLNDRHILTFEDPIEFVYPTDLKSLISQRDMRTDMVSELLALKSGLRQVPSLLVVQEIRDEPTAALVLILASLGIRVITTIHADTACEAVGSFLKWLDGKRWSWGCFMLSKYLVCSIAQRLVTAVGDNSRRYVLHELLWAKPTPRSRAVSNLIAQAAKDEHSLDGLDGQILNGGSDTLHISWRSSLERWEQAGVKFDESLADELSNLSR